MSLPQPVASHKHFRMGVGIYRLVGQWSAPSKAMLEANPSGYALQMSLRPLCCKLICDHCGTSIIHHFIIEDEEKQRFSIGSSCVSKLGQHELVSAVQKFERERKSRERKVAAKNKQIERQKIIDADLAAQRDQNGGLTDREFAIKEKELRDEFIEDNCWELTRPIVLLLKNVGTNFCNQIISGMKQGRMPEGKAKEIVIEIMAKQCSSNSNNKKAYSSSLDEMRSLYDTVAGQCQNVKEAAKTLKLKRDE
ncbi:hypothetical protein [Vibrio cholerae]|uniref:hypothetical protein n=1 Tax=Vibrio cholerae TaxID=666 RepID=UPI000E697BD9|nr:hypothetical protein [Vibrio cholerae]